MATWKSVQDSIKQSMKQLGELYEAQAQERKDFQIAVQNQAKEQMAQFQNQLMQYKKSNEELRKEIKRLKGEIAQRDIYIQGLEESVPQEELDDTFPMPISNAFNEITQEDSLSETLLEAERRKEDARLAKEAEELLAAQKERERAYQQKLTEQKEQQERARQQKLQREQRERAERAQQEQQKIDARNTVLSQLEQEFAEASAKLSLAQKERDSDSSLADLNDRFALAKKQVLHRIPSLTKEYEAAKSSLQESTSREIQALSTVDESEGTPDEKEKNAKSELASLERKVEEIDTQLNGFFVRNRKRIEQEREAHNQRIDELNTLIMYLRNQKNQATTDSRSSEKIEEIHRRMDKFEQQWQERLSAVQLEVDNELASLDKQFKNEEEAITKRLESKIQKLQDKKWSIEKQIERFS